MNANWFDPAPVLMPLSDKAALFPEIDLSYNSRVIPVCPETWEEMEARVAKTVGIIKESSGLVKFDAGALTPEEINAMLNTLPIDITFVDRDDSVKYFTQGKDRIFARPITVIGRKVQNCHPPASVHIVQKILDDFKKGKKDHEDFWIRMGDKYVFIRYFAVRNANGEYLGTLEVTQDIAPIRNLEGEKRLLSD